MQTILQFPPHRVGGVISIFTMNRNHNNTVEKVIVKIMMRHIFYRDLYWYEQVQHSEIFIYFSKLYEKLAS